MHHDASSGTAPALPSALLTAPRRRAIRDGLVVGGLLFAAYLFVVQGSISQTVGFDAAAYWNVDLQHPYALWVGAFMAFNYPPPAARLFAPASAIPWVAFWWLWMSVLVGTAIWLGWRKALYVFAFPPVAIELYHGNIHLLVAAAIALGFRYPATWAFVALTKVTPAVGLVWFLVRREWRQLGIALGVTAAIVALSLALDLRLWQEWLGQAIGPNLGQAVDQPNLDIPLLIRLPIAVAIVAWGGLTDRRWSVPVAAVLALPVLWIAGFAILAAIPALGRPELQGNRSTAAELPGTAVGIASA